MVHCCHGYFVFRMAMAGNRKVASWNVALPEGEFLIEFDHGTTSGKRIIWVNQKEVLRRDWMFRLVGPDSFSVGRFQFVVDVVPDGTFGFEYELMINGLDAVRFQNGIRKNCIVWNVVADREGYRIVLEKDTLDVWVNGQKVKTKDEFTEEGQEMRLQLGTTPGQIKCVSSGNKKQGMLYKLIVDDQVISAE